MGVRRREEMKGGEGESDLKRGHVRVLNACDRLYLCALDRIHVVCVCVKCGLMCSNKRK
jgi:hypothetical protein